MATSKCTVLMTTWMTPEIVAFLDDASPAMQRVMMAAGVAPAAVATQDHWVLRSLNGHLAIVRPDGVFQYVDFTTGKSRHRSRQAGAGAVHLSRSLGIPTFKKRHGRLPTVIDATGGWGQDAWAIASLGCLVTVIEKHPIVYAILAHGLAKSADTLECQKFAERITLINQDACQSLKDMHADVIYLDPMYPNRARKRADSKKGMQILQSLLGPGDEKQSAGLLDAALSSQARRVVVKRPKGADALAPEQHFQGQTFVIESPNTRYDVYQRVDAD